MTTALDELTASGLRPLVDDLRARAVPAERVTSEVEWVWWSSLSEEIALRDPRVAAHDGRALTRSVGEFAEADRAVVSANAERVRGAVADHVTEVVRDHPEQETLLRAEGARARRLAPLRDLVTRCPDLVTAVRPCWVMSPLVVASVLPPGQWFDVVVFDEASQVPPAEAVSAISRARQVVVAGDSHQLPPTTFFTTVTGDDPAAVGADEALTEGVESILDVLAAALPSRRLSWHYRSLDERLIEFANAEVYEGSLVTFPGTGVDPVVRLVPVDGHGIIGEGDTALESTPTEVDRVVELVLEHARTRPDRSLGVIALGIIHATRVDEAVRRALAEAPADLLAFFDEDRPEPFFVKNLERVQGDERDDIVLTVGYGKTPHGRVLHRFGPLNLEGGERRLNVAITRARRSMTVVSAIAAEDLDPARLRARGAVMLRDFLSYAAGGPLPGVAAPGGAGRGTRCRRRQACRMPCPPRPLPAPVPSCSPTSPGGCVATGWSCTRTSARRPTPSTWPSRTPPARAGWCWRWSPTARSTPRCAPPATATGCAPSSSSGSAGGTCGCGRPTSSATRPATCPGSSRPPGCARPRAMTDPDPDDAALPTERVRRATGAGVAAGCAAGPSGPAPTRRPTTCPMSCRRARSRSPARASTTAGCASSAHPTGSDTGSASECSFEVIAVAASSR